MAENQTATEDSGQQSTQHQTHPHHNQQHQQQQHSHNDNSQTLSTHNSEDLSSALPSPTTPPNENNSASSPDEPETVVVANHHHQTNQQQQEQHQQQERSMIDRQVTTKIKAVRRNTIQTTTVPVRATNTTSIKKPSLTKMNSLTGTTGNGEKNNTDKHHLQQQQQQHHHHHHQHNSMTNHHHHHHQQNNSSPSTGTNSNSTAIRRTTTESLRLNAIPPNGGGGNAASNTAGGDTLSNATSNSSIHSNLTNNSSSSASVAPKSTSTNASHGKSTTSKSSNASSKASSPNNNNSIASVAASSSHTSRSHHSHGHIQGHGHGHTAAVSRKPKTTSSFQITSVTVGHPKAPAAPDNGEEESADDLDESHTDDNSRITDLENETPSMSEDTFSKEEIYYHQDDALSSTAPVIPTSSQYGLVVATLGAQDISNVQVNVGENFINVVPSGSGIKKEDLKDSSQHRSERFKVVKIESTEPFRRGRWVCMDYLDHSSVSGKEDGSGVSGAGNNNEKTEAGGGVDNSEHAAPKTTQSMILGPSAAAVLENHVDPSTVPAADGNWNFSDTTVNVGGGGGGIATAPASVVHGIQQFVETSEGTDQQKQMLPQEPQYQTPPQEVNANATQQMTMTAQAPPEVMQPAVPSDYATVAAQKLKKSLEELKKQEEAIAASEKAAAAAGGVYMPGQSQPLNFEAMQQQQQVSMQQSQQVAMQQQQQQQQQQQHAATLPGNISMQNGNISIATDNNNVNVAQQAQQQQQMMVEPQQTQSLGYAVEASQQQPMSPAPQQMQVPPNFVTASFQGTPQQTPPQQSPQMQDAGQAMQQQQQHQQQMTQQQISQQQQLQQALPQQQQPPTTQLQQQTSQTDGVNNLQNVAAVACMQQMQQQQQQQSHSQAAQQQPQLPPQFQQLQQQQQPLAPGQTMPILTQMTNYDLQQQQQQQQHHLQQQQSAPASMMDNSALLASLQAQQQQHQQQQHQQSTATNTLSGPTNIIMQTASVNAPSQYQQQPQQQQQQHQSQLPIDSAPSTSVSANSSNSTVNLNPITTATIMPITSSNNSLPVGTNVANSNNNNTTTNIDNQTVLQQQQQQQMQPPQQPSTSSQLQTTQQQLQQNTETETESSNVSRLTQAMSTNNKMHHRKRAFSTPFLTPYEQQMLSSTGSELPQVLLMPSSMGGNNDQNVYFYNKTASGRSSFCVDESMWPAGQVPRFVNMSGNNNPPLITQLGSDSNIYTNLALGNERYKLPVEFLTSLSPGVSITTSSTQREGEDEDELEDLINENDEDLEESVDQFSPLLYPNTQQQQRSQPIAISAGNSPVHKPKTAALAGGQKSPMRVASPTAGHYQHHMAFSASPTARPHPYLPFYASSPDTRQNQTTPQHKAAYSYDPSFGANISHLPLPLGQQEQHQSPQQAQQKQLPRQPPFPQQRHSQPSTSASHFTSPIHPTQNLSTASIESAPGAIIFATSPTSSLTNSASGTSAVAIDNKIEQAMDLVKSHLMIAVREEVEVLKEKISELMDKINQLEVENTILKANMSQETLQQLQMQTQLQIAGSTPTNGSNMLTGAPSPAAITAAPTPVVTTATAASAVAANINSQSNIAAAATPQSNVGSGTATPTTQQPVEQNVETTQTANAVNAEDNQGSVQAANGPMS